MKWYTPMLISVDFCKFKFTHSGWCENWYEVMIFVDFLQIMMNVRVTPVNSEEPVSTRSAPTSVSVHQEEPAETATMVRKQMLRLLSYNNPWKLNPTNWHKSTVLQTIASRGVVTLGVHVLVFSIKFTIHQTGMQTSSCSVDSCWILIMP